MKGANLPLWLKIAAFQPFICLTDDFELAIKQPVADKRISADHNRPILHYSSTRKGLNVNKSELIEAIAKEADISKAAAGKALDGFTKAVTTALKKGDTVTLVGFGTFYVGERAERKGRNPQTGKELIIPAAKSPKFRAGKALKDAL